MSEVQYTNELHLRYKERTVAGAEAVAELMVAALPPLNRIVDLGCGHGHWLAAFHRKCGCDVVGYDGDYIRRSDLVIPADRFHPIRLDKPFDIQESSDLAISVEVAEHLPEAAGLRLVDQLCKASNVVLFSAAIPGQVGDHHINLRPHRYWKMEFAKRGYVALDFIRPALWHREDILLCYRQNLLVFVKDGCLADPRFHRLAAQPRANCLTLVDEDVLAQSLKPLELLRRMVSG